MNRTARFPLARLVFLAGILTVPLAAAAPFSSGSTGADGALAPTVNTALNMPPNGVFHFTTIDIPAGVTVTFNPNASNTPVVMLASGNANIAGAINVDGGGATATTGSADNPNGGKGGPGGFDGGRGGLPENNRSGDVGLGPGGAMGGTNCTTSYMEGGGGGGFGVAGNNSQCYSSSTSTTKTGTGGPAYGSVAMLPLVGGSGGGGGSGGKTGAGSPGAGGGGGGGALLLVASGSVTLTGSIQARGGNGGAARNCSNNSALDNGGPGGGGSGGAIRIVASAYSGAGTLSVTGGGAGCSGVAYIGGGAGAVGRTSVDVITGGVFDVGGMPTLTVTSIGGVAAPAQPSGSGDVQLAADLANPVTVEITATGIPVGTVVKLTVLHPFASAASYNSTPLAGTLASSAASASISVLTGTSSLLASTTYAITLAMGEALSVYAQGERVERVALSAAMGEGTQATLITISGKEFEVPLAVLATMPAQG